MPVVTKYAATLVAGSALSSSPASISRVSKPARARLLARGAAAGTATHDYVVERVLGPCMMRCRYRESRASQQKQDRAHRDNSLVELPIVTQPV